jgi:hypothetical protein
MIHALPYFLVVRPFTVTQQLDLRLEMIESGFEKGNRGISAPPIAVNHLLSTSEKRKAWFKTKA